MTPKLRTVIAAVGALIYLPVGVRILTWSIPSIWIAARDYASRASGGVGAASGAVDAIFASYVLLAMGSIVANRILAAWARQQGGNIKVLHRWQRWSIVFAFVVAITSVAGFPMFGGPLALVLLPFGGAMWGLQFVLTATLLATYTIQEVRRGSPSNL